MSLAEHSPKSESAQTQDNINPIPLTSGNESKDQNVNRNGDGNADGNVDGDASGNLVSRGPSDPFAEKLKNLGVSKERASVTELLEVRTKD